MNQEHQKFECWALVEVMGHSRYAGLVTEQAVGGCNFVRVEVPAFEGYPAFTKLLGQSSIFAITPVAEQVARGMAQQFRNQPVTVYDMPDRDVARRSIPHFDEGDSELDMDDD